MSLNPRCRTSAFHPIHERPHHGPPKHYGKRPYLYYETYAKHHLARSLPSHTDDNKDTIPHKRQFCMQDERNIEGKNNTLNTEPRPRGRPPKSDCHFEGDFQENTSKNSDVSKKRDTFDVMKSEYVHNVWLAQQELKNQADNSMFAGHVGQRLQNCPMSDDAYATAHAPSVPTIRHIRESREHHFYSHESADTGNRRPVPGQAFTVCNRYSTKHSCGVQAKRFDDVAPWQHGYLCYDNRDIPREEWYHGKNGPVVNPRDERYKPQCYCQSCIISTEREHLRWMDMQGSGPYYLADQETNTSGPCMGAEGIRGRREEGRREEPVEIIPNHCDKDSQHCKGDADQVLTLSNSIHGKCGAPVIVNCFSLANQSREDNLANQSRDDNLTNQSREVNMTNQSREVNKMQYHQNGGGPFDNQNSHGSESFASHHSREEQLRLQGKGQENRDEHSPRKYISIEECGDRETPYLEQKMQKEGSLNTQEEVDQEKCQEPNVYRTYSAQTLKWNFNARIRKRIREEESPQLQRNYSCSPEHDSIHAVSSCLATRRLEDSAPRRMDVAPRRLDVAPSRLDVAPRRPDVAPSRLDVPPRRPDVPPSRLDVAPRRPDVPPRRLDVAPSRLDVPPSRLDVAPRRPDVPPSRLDVAPRRPDVPPRRLDVAPTRLDVAPRRPDVQPSRLDVAPRRPDVQPSRLDAAPRRPDVQPSRLDVAPRRLDVQPSRLDVAPRRPDVPPRRPDVAPRRPDVQPSRLEVAPRRLDVPPRRPDVPPRTLDVAPSRLDVAPRKLDVVSRRMDVAPRRLDVAPRRLDVAPLPIDGPNERYLKESFSQKFDPISDTQGIVNHSINTQTDNSTREPRHQDEAEVRVSDSRKGEKKDEEADLTKVKQEHNQYVTLANVTGFIEDNISPSAPSRQRGFSFIENCESENERLASPAQDTASKKSEASGSLLRNHQTSVSIVSSSKNARDTLSMTAIIEVINEKRRSLDVQEHTNLEGLTSKHSHELGLNIIVEEREDIGHQVKLERDILPRACSINTVKRVTPSEQSKVDDLPREHRERETSPREYSINTVKRVTPGEQSKLDDFPREHRERETSPREYSINTVKRVTPGEQSKLDDLPREHRERETTPREYSRDTVGTSPDELSKLDDSPGKHSQQFGRDTVDVQSKNTGHYTQWEQETTPRRYAIERNTPDEQRKLDDLPKKRSYELRRNTEVEQSKDTGHHTQWERDTPPRGNTAGKTTPDEQGKDTSSLNEQWEREATPQQNDIQTTGKSGLDEHRKETVRLRKQWEQMCAIVQSNAMGYEKPKEYLCEFCGRAFTHLSSLNNHTRTHTGQKPFKCEYCNKRFAQSGVLTAHMRTHTGDKPFKCNICAREFAQTTTLSNHIRTHTGQKPFRCRSCFRAFAQSSTRNKHELSHTREKPFSCRYCERSFTQSSTVMRHMRTHEKGTDYRCIHCGMVFAYLYALDKHLDIHGREKNNSLDEAT